MPVKQVWNATMMTQFELYDKDWRSDCDVRLYIHQLRCLSEMSVSAYHSLKIFPFGKGHWYVDQQESIDLGEP